MPDLTRAICNCGLTFKHWSNLMRHQKSTCKRPQLLCPYCMESVPLLEVLTAHLGKCQVCPWVRAHHRTQVTAKKVPALCGTREQDEPSASLVPYRRVTKKTRIWGDNQFRSYVPRDWSSHEKEPRGPDRKSDVDACPHVTITEWKDERNCEDCKMCRKLWTWKLVKELVLNFLFK